MEVLNSFLEKMQNNFNIEQLIKLIYQDMQFKSYHHRLHYKKYENSLVQLFTESSQEYTKWEIYNLCRSIIFSLETGKIISFSHPNIEYITFNKFEQINSSLLKDLKYTESHEGTLISVFFYNDKWYYATRKEIDMYKTFRYIFGNKSILSHGEMFDECLVKYGLTKEQFEQQLDKSCQYNFEIVHYDNKINMSYDIRFGEKYAKLFLLFIRDSENKMVSNEIAIDFSNKLNIEMSPEISYDDLIEIMKSKELLEIEGYIFTRVDDSGKTHLCKVLHDNYHEKMKYTSTYKTEQEQYIYLYQKNLLEDVLTKMNRKVFSDQIETIGLVNAVFKYIGQRMLDIYYTFNNNKMLHKNEDNFKRLFIDNKEYNIIFYTLGKMKGIHKNKQLTINEMLKFLKYNMSANDVWKLGNVIKEFELKEKLLKPYYTKIMNVFFEEK